MTKLEQLIKEHCPNGLEYVEIGSVVNYEQPTKYIVNSTDYDDNYEIPVLTAGQTFILGYTDETDGVYNASKESPVIIFDDFTGAFKWVDFPFKVKSSAMKILTADESKTTLRYIYHIMSHIGFTSAEHKRLWISIYSAFQIPLPPLAVQAEIVKILDEYTESVTALQQELEKELTARKKQYEYYRDLLLDFGAHGGGTSECEWRTLGELVDFRNGKGHEKDIVSFGDYIVVNSKFISTQGQVVKYSDKQICPLYIDDILMVMSDLPNGRALAKCYLVSEDNRFTLNQRIGCFHVKNEDTILTMFLFYVLNRNKQLLKYDNGVDQTNLKKNDILNIVIPVPPIEEQERIVSILDRFDKLCNDISEGLPAEIEARRKQYEYYRDKLLSFEERKNA